VAGAGARLVHVHDKLVAVLARQNLVGGLHDRVGQASIQPSGLLVHQRGRTLDPDDGIHKRRQRPEPRNREVFRRAQGLNPV
jgi:hypothetical protein